jgi:hypothetical protein
MPYLEGLRAVSAEPNLSIARSKILARAFNPRPLQALHRISGFAVLRRLADRSLAEVFQFVAYMWASPGRKSAKQAENCVAVL